MNGFRNSSQINTCLHSDFRHKMWFLEGSGLDPVLSCCQEGIAEVSCHPWQPKPLQFPLGTAFKHLPWKFSLPLPMLQKLGRLHNVSATISGEFTF